MLHTHTIAMPNPSSSSSPSPLPPATSAAAHRRSRRLLPSPNHSSTAPTSTSDASASSSASSSSSNLSYFPSFSPAPSPFHHRFLSPLRTSAVPFSWEHRPGIPKTPARQQPRGKPAAKPPPLPLPPSLFSSKVVADPFPAAGADYLVAPENSTKTRRRRRRQQRRRRPALAAALTDWMAVLSLYRSCARPRDCLADAGPPPLPRPRALAKAGRDTCTY